jgi:hypothetical protein
MKISTVVKMVSVLAASVMLTGCGWFIGEKVEVPPAHVGKIMGQNGYREGTIPTSKFRLDGCVVWCDKLITMSIADFTVTEPMEVFMPEDKLIMTFELGITLSPNPEQFDSLFNRVAPENDTIPIRGIYTTYAQRIIQSQAREVVSNYTIAQIASSREVIAQELTQALAKTIGEQTPFGMRFLGITDIDYPDVITNAQINAAERRERIQQEEAQLEISRVELERTLQETRLQRAIDIERAQAEAEVNRILGDSITPEYIRYRELGALDSLATSDSTVWVPSKLLDTVAGQVAVGNNR